MEVLTPITMNSQHGSYFPDNLTKLASEYVDLRSNSNVDLVLHSARIDNTPPFVLSHWDSESIEGDGEEMLEVLKSSSKTSP